MKSPFTGIPMESKMRHCVIFYKGQRVTFRQHAFFCPYKRVYFTTTEQDEANLLAVEQAYKQAVQ